MASAVDAVQALKLDRPSRIATLQRGLDSQLAVVNALILRETRTRFGRNRLGYLWAVIEPVLVTLTFYAVLKVSKRELPAGMTGGDVTGAGGNAPRRIPEIGSAVSASNNGKLARPQVV